MTRACALRFVRPAALLIAGLPFLAAPPAGAQSYNGCLRFVKNLKTTSCIGDPIYDKFFEAGKVHWNGKPYLVINTGNNLELYDISTPLSPSVTDRSGFGIPNLGDSDYDLINYSMCDDCRYGVANFKLATVVFDLGTGTKPNFSSAFDVYDPAVIAGSTGFTFSYGGHQYMMGSDLPGGSCADGFPVFLVNGTDSFAQAGCVPRTGAPSGWGVQNGIELAGDYIGLSDFNGNVLVFKITDSGTTALTFTRVGDVLYGGLGRNIGAATDLSQRRALFTKLYQPASLYKLSTSDPPVELLNQHTADANLAAIGGEMLFMSRAYSGGSEALYDVDDFAGSASPTPLAPDFWLDAWSWNQNDCEKPTGAVLSDDGTALYTTDYSVVKVIDTTLCGGPVQPIAHVGITPATVFPGDSVTVTNTSSGGTRSAIWVTAGANPLGTIVAGARTWSTSTPPRTFTVPQDVAAGQDYYGHVAVETDDFLCNLANPTACDVQYATQQVGIDRTPVVLGITYLPTAPLTGDTVTFSATAEGNPSSWTWDIVSPITHTHTSSPTNVVLGESGAWSVTATAHYDHDGGNYSDSDTITLNISSVFATFTVSPSSPLNTQDVTLNGSASRPPPSASVTYDWSVTNGSHSYTGCPHAAVCTIPASTLQKNTTYTITLTLTDSGDPTHPSVATKSVDVGDGDINLGFTVSPSDPDRGQSVGFAITGVVPALDWAQWNFGDTGCSGYQQIYTCDPAEAGYDCKSASYKYSSSGTKTVRLTVSVGGNTFGPVIQYVYVQSAGSCTTTPPPTPTPTPPPVGSCTFTVSSPSLMPFQGGPGAVTVTTAAGCTWEAKSFEGWLHVTSASSSGPGPASFTADLNQWPADRSGKLVVAGKTVMVTQHGFVANDFEPSNPSPERGEPVTFTFDHALEPVSWDFGGRNCAGDSQVVQCALMPDACRGIQWSYPTEGTYFVTLTTTTGVPRTKMVIVRAQGKCPVPCSASQAPDPAFSITPSSPMAGETVTFTHLGHSACEYSLSPSAASLPAVGGSRSFAVTTDSACPWTATSGSAWITITSAASGSGPGQVVYTVGVNPGEARSGTILVDDVPHTVNQEAACSVSLDPASASFGADGGSGTVTVTADTGCTWSAASDSDWLTVTAGASGSGGGTVEYEVAANSGEARAGGITVNGATHAVDQAASSDIDQPTAKALAIDFIWSPDQPEIGQLTAFHITGRTGDVRAEWNFDGSGCTGYEGTPVCIADDYLDCLDYAHKFASGGSHTVSVTVKDLSGATLGTATHTVTVQSAGSCGGTTVCSYSLSPGSATLAAGGGQGSFNVSTAGGCSWTAASNRTWLGVTSPTGEVTGAGAVHYSAGVNAGVQRSGSITVQGDTVSRTFYLTQEAPAPTGDDSATEWHWTITRTDKAGVPPVTSEEQSFQHVFDEPGAYHVSLVAGNCMGSRSKALDFDVVTPSQAADDYLVPAAVHTPGLNDTLWKTDLKLFNPCSTAVTAIVEFLPENTNNASIVVPRVQYELPPKATKVVDDVVQQIPGVVGDKLKGSLRYRYEGAEGCMPLVISRTYNDTAFGTFGQFVPAVPVLPVGDDPLFLTGLASDSYYRSNLGLANFGPEDVWVTATLYDKDGAPLGDHPVNVKVYGHSTSQVVKLAQAAGVLNDVNIFSAEIDPHGADVSVYASVVDGQTGDSVTYRPFATGDQEVWVPGIAHLVGVDDTQWRTDITFFNPTDEPIDVDVTYMPSEKEIDFQPAMAMHIAPGAALYYTDFLGEANMLPKGPDSKGYLVVSSRDGSPLPEIAARTYNLAPDGGTFGQTLKTFSSVDMVRVGESGFLPGVANSASKDLGFRTNLGLLSPETATRVDIVLYDIDGSKAAEVNDLWVGQGQFLQFDLFRKKDVALGDVDMDGSVEVKVLQGGPLGVFTSVIDNRTQDPVLIPAIRGPASP